jgi:hypothetical protein
MLGHRISTGRFCVGRWTDAIYRVLPNYLTDLNAMHEAEKVLEYRIAPQCSDYIDTRDAFLRHLQRIQRNTPSEDRIITLSTGWCFLRATAAQRAEAFLRTLNLWKE